MSYNIGAIAIVKSDGFCITRSQLDALREEHGDEAPEGSFFDEEWPARCCDDVRGMLFVNQLDWHGEGSGNYWDNLKACLAKFLGSADLILTWEDGDSHSGLRLCNGVVTEHEVVMTLGKGKRRG